MLVDPIAYADQLVEEGFDHDDLQYVMTKLDTSPYVGYQWKWDCITRFVSHFGRPSLRPVKE